MTGFDLPGPLPTYGSAPSSPTPPPVAEPYKPLPMLGEPQGDYSAFAGVGLWTQIAGSMLGAVGTYYSASAQKDAIKSQASSLEFGARMSDFNARSAEDDARAVMEAGQTEMARLTLQQGQERASIQASQAASGTTTDGSNAEVLASQRILQRIDQMTLRANTVRAANAQRMRGVNARIEAAMGRASSANAYATAGSINPWASTTGSILSNAGSLLGSYVNLQRYRGGR